MSYSSYLTKVSLTGSKASVVKMLNAAIKNVGKGDAILPEDSIEALNARFHFSDEKGYENRLRFHIHDFLTKESIDSDAMKLNRQDAFNDWCKEEGVVNNADIAVVVNNVIDKGDDYEVELSLGEEEYEKLFDWAGWADLTEVYGVTIYADLYDFGTYPGYCGTTIHELVDGEVKTTKVEPSLDTEGFYKDFSTLIDLYPGRYKAVLVEALENEIEQLQEMARTFRLSVIKDNLKANDGYAEIPEGWTVIEGFAFKGCKDLKSITLPSSLKTIGTRAFEGCENLREITIPSSVDSIGDCAFKDCPCAEGMDERYWKEIPDTEVDDAWINEILG